MSGVSYLTGMVAFTVLGDPVPKERPRYGLRRTYTPKRTVVAETRVVDAFDVAHPLRVPMSGPVGMRVQFYRASRRRIDLDNLCKLILDALNGVAYVDDVQVVHLTAEKHYDKHNPRTLVELWGMP